jgi:alpha-mannosidase II
LVQCVELYPLKSDKIGEEIPAISVWNLVDIRTQANFELAVNMETDINNSDFYTDLNSYQFIRRKTYNKIPLQANVYPMPSGAYIHDNKLRLTALSAQTLGVCSLKKSQLEIFLDRRLQQDDNRGLEQPVLDNKITSSRFILAFEKTKNLNDNTVQPNLDIQMKLFDLQHPVMSLLPTVNQISLDKLPTKMNLIEGKLPCDVRILNVRTMQTDDEKASNTIGLILHRLGYNCEIPASNCDSVNSEFSLKDLFSFISIIEAKKTFLTFRTNPETNNAISVSKSIFDLVHPMEIQAFKLVF